MKALDIIAAERETREAALVALALEATHYANTGRGEHHLRSAIRGAWTALGVDPESSSLAVGKTHLSVRHGEAFVNGKSLGSDPADLTVVDTFITIAELGGAR